MIDILTKNCVAKGFDLVYRVNSINQTELIGRRDVNVGVMLKKQLNRRGCIVYRGALVYTRFTRMTCNLYS